MGHAVGPYPPDCDGLVVQEAFGDWYDLLTKQDAQEANESHDRWCRRSDVEDTIDGARRLASAGLTDIEIVPSSFVVRAKNADGRSVILVLYPDLNLEWQVSPVDDDDPSTSSPNQERR